MPDTSDKNIDDATLDLTPRDRFIIYLVFLLLIGIGCLLMRFDESDEEEFKKCFLYPSSCSMLKYIL